MLSVFEACHYLLVLGTIKVSVLRIRSYSVGIIGKPFTKMLTISQIM